MILDLGLNFKDIFLKKKRIYLWKCLLYRKYIVNIKEDRV